MQTVMLADGTKVHLFVAAGVVAALVRLLKAGEIQALMELKQKAETGLVVYSVHATRVLYEQSLIGLDGEIDSDVRSVILDVLAIEGDTAKVFNLWVTDFSEAAVQAAVDSLDVAELADIIRRFDYSYDIGHLAGYAKLAAFCKGGVVTRQLRRALREAAKCCIG